jgi:hypothetical protein
MVASACLFSRSGRKSRPNHMRMAMEMNPYPEISLLKTNHDVVYNTYAFACRICIGSRFPEMEKKEEHKLSKVS